MSNKIVTTDRLNTFSKNVVLQVSTMPTASSSWVDKVVLYIGTTNSTYTNGLIYKCVNNNGTYEWVIASVQEASAGNSNITFSSTFTLDASDWDSETKQQTVAIPLDTNKRNVIDITVSELPTWSECNVYAISESSTGITFQCDTIPEDDLTFKVTSMEEGSGGIVALDKTCTLAANAWVGNDVPYTQTVNVAGIVATDKAFCDVSVSSTVATGLDEIDDWALISKIESGAGTMTFSCYEDKPTTDLTVNIKVVR